MKRGCLTLCCSTIFSQIIILFHLKPTIAQRCSSFTCDNHNPDSIRFPFRESRNQSTRCGYPGFELTCNKQHTLLKLPTQPDPYVVFAIDYPDQLIWISDPNGCILKRVMNLNLTGSPYLMGPATTTYSFLNCSVPVNDPDTLPEGSSVISCMSGKNYTVVSTYVMESKATIEKEWKCQVIKTMDAPIWWPDIGYGLNPNDMSDVYLQLSWDIPSCGDCELRGGSCGFLPQSDLQVHCFLNNNNAISRVAETALILGIGIPGMACLIIVSLYISTKVRANNETENNSDIEGSPTVITVGLDKPTIESYPKTILGESIRLPKPSSDGTCSICLSEYQPKDTLRSIPECNHFFHLDCIDEWLQVNSTCPVCRSSPHHAHEDADQ